MAGHGKREAALREGRRHSKVDPAKTRRASTAVTSSRREAAKTCGWCGGPIEIKPTGRIPKWCSAACRQRAWEQSRAAASGRAAVTIVERVVEVPAVRAPRRDEWAPLLCELTAQLDDGRVYARDLPDLRTALTELTAAFDRRRSRRPRH